MSRLVDPKRTRKALAKVRRLAAKAPALPEASLSDWERDFLSEVEGRLERYGSAFADPTKGRPDDALSRLQEFKLQEIAAKAKGKPRKPFASQSAFRRKNRPDAQED